MKNKKSNEVKILRDFIYEFCPLYTMQELKEFSYFELINCVKEIAKEL